MLIYIIYNIHIMCNGYSSNAIYIHKDFFFSSSMISLVVFVCAFLREKFFSIRALFK